MTHVTIWGHLGQYSKQSSIKKIVSTYPLAFVKIGDFYATYKMKLM